MTIRLFHCSDLHAGPPFDAAVAERVLVEAHAYKPDAFVVSGDFVQRADIATQWATIIEWLKRAPKPLFTVPGNHDVPLFHIWQRLFKPNVFYHKHINTDVAPVLHLDGVSLIGANSAHGWTVDGGTLTKAAQAQLLVSAASCPPDNRRILVMHHHLLTPPGLGRRNGVSQPMTIARLMDQAKIDVVLSGHVHLSYVGHTRDLLPTLGHGAIICQSGTTTSRRGKGREKHQFAYNTIEISDTLTCIRRHVYDPVSQGFIEQVAHHEYFRPW